MLRCITENWECTVAIRVANLTEAQWEAARHPEQPGDLRRSASGRQTPKEIEAVFVKVGAGLMPIDPTELRSSCTCCDPGESVCKPVLAAYAAVADMLTDDPWLMLRLRRRDRQQVLHGLNAKRNQVIGAATPRTAEGEQSLVYRVGGSPSQLDDSPILDAELDHYWVDPDLRSNSNTISRRH